MLIAVLAGAAAGLAANLLLHDSAAVKGIVDYVTHPVGQIWLRMLRMLVVPLLFAALVIGIGELPLRSLGRLAGKTFAYTVIVSTIAVLIGMGAVNMFRPGEGLDPAIREQALHGAVTAVPKAPNVSAVELIIAIIPTNPLEAAAGNDMIGWLAFSLFFGVGLALVRTEGADVLRRGIAGLNDVMMRLVDMVLGLAPIGVACLLFTLMARVGVDVLRPLLAYVGVVLLALGIHMFVVYPLALRLIGGYSPLRFFRATRLAIVTAFSTSSSAATLPTALKVAEEELHLPRHVSRFVLTVGATMNQNGTALFEGVTVLFLAQLFGVELSVAQQALVMVISILGGIGTAGVPAGSLPVIAMILVMLGIPAEGIGLILGVDRFLDMCRTTLNVTGDLVAAVVVARGETSPAEASA
jgi:dicarboxylate/amino acid:cation (Na+ or H+) symporter, DAACS family